MESNRIIVNAWTGEGWYEDGQKRLIESIGNEKILATSEKYLKNSVYFSEDCPYTIKAAAIDEAIKIGYKKILWLDCSVQLIKPLDEVWKTIDQDGYYFNAGGWNCAQECNDFSLDYFGYTRDEAEMLPALWSCIFGFDLNNEKSKKVIDLFLQSAIDGVFHGSRHHDNQSSDPRFQHHRQDQSALSLAFHKVGIEKMHPPGVHMWYSGMCDQKESNIFKVQGM